MPRDLPGPGEGGHASSYSLPNTCLLAAGPGWFRPMTPGLSLVHSLTSVVCLHPPLGDRSNMQGGKGEFHQSFQVCSAGDRCPPDTPATRALLSQLLWRQAPLHTTYCAGDWAVGEGRVEETWIPNFTAHSSRMVQGWPRRTPRLGPSLSFQPPSSGFGDPGSVLNHGIIVTQENRNGSRATGRSCSQ